MKNRRSVKIGRKNLKMQMYKHCWMKTQLNVKTIDRTIKCDPIHVCTHWERLGRKKILSHVNWRKMKGENYSWNLACQAKKKRFLHLVVTGDEKFFRQPKAQKFKDRSSSSLNITTKEKCTWKEGFPVVWIWWDNRGAVQCKLLKPRETITSDRHKKQLIKLNRE